MFIVDKSALYHRIGIDDERWETQKQERGNIRAEYFRKLKESRPFGVKASQLFATEEDEFCILYQISCTPSCHLLYAYKRKPTEETVRQGNQCHNWSGVSDNLLG